MSDDDIYKELNKGYENRTLSFMHYVTSDNKQAQDIDFIGRVIADKHILFDIVAAVDFDKKKYKDICKCLDTDEKTKEAMYTVRSILKDCSQANVDSAMKWLPKLFIPGQFVPDPEDADRKIGMLENHFSVIYYLTDLYFKEDLSQEKFLICLKKLKEIHPEMEFAASKSHSAEYIAKLHKTDKRKDAIIAFIKSCV